MLTRRRFLKNTTLLASISSIGNSDGHPGEQFQLPESQELVKSMNPQTTLKLQYSKAATHFNDALPLGNGRLGLMVYGGVDKERIQINDDTLWSGGPRDYRLPEAKALLPKIRELLFEGNYEEGSELTRGLQGPDCEAFVTAGEMNMDFSGGSKILDYKRQLDLETGLATVSYTTSGGTVNRESFVSHPAGVAVTRIETKGDPQHLTLSLQSPHPHKVRVESANKIILSGYLPYHVKPHFYNKDRDGRPLGPEEIVSYDPNRGMRFEIHLCVRIRDGQIKATDNAIHISNSQTIEIFMATGSSFNGWDKDPVKEGLDSSLLPSANLESALAKSYASLRTEHIADHESLFNRFSLQLGRAQLSTHDTDDQIKSFSETEDPNLITLLCQYGRYLMIAGSRPGTQALNLQGIWSDYVRPPWNCNYTTNINVQMNYWPAELMNLSECHEPMIDLARELSESGRAVADANYGARGWVADHNTDLWRISCPVGDFGMGNPKCSIWPLAGAWFCQHVFEHYAHGLDENYLRDTAWPIMKSAVEFFLDYLIEDDSGQLVTAPSTSPENEFQYAPGKRAGVAIASTMDMSLLRELFSNCIVACEVLNVDPVFKSELESASSRLRKPRIGQYGHLTEWSEDWDDPKDKHRHVSHLYGLYPGNEFTVERTPNLVDAARKSLELRGDDATGWSLGWKVNLWARLRDGEHAYKILKTLLRPVHNEQDDQVTGGGLYGNLFDAHPPFQIDGNFGASAGIVEMLVQKIDSTIFLLPATPKQWDCGHIKGVRLKGGITIDFSWENSAVTLCQITTKKISELRLSANGKIQEIMVLPDCPTSIKFT